VNARGKLKSGSTYFLIYIQYVCKIRAASGHFEHPFWNTPTSFLNYNHVLLRSAVYQTKSLASLLDCAQPPSAKVRYSTEAHQNYLENLHIDLFVQYICMYL